eukprot:16805-Pyramimonas_sp.AAC.1
MSKFRGRVVFQGNSVKDESGLAALFAEAASSASHIEASKVIDAVPCLPGCSGQQSDAVSACTQALLYGDGRIVNVDAWVELPRDRWPKEWGNKCRRPVVQLRLALYGHPLSDVSWERHCQKALFSAGWELIEGWESTFRREARPGAVRLR